jgi:hypothetical protein
MNDFRKRLDKLKIKPVDLEEMTGEKLVTINKYYYGNSPVRPIFMSYLEQLESGVSRMPDKVLKWCRDQLKKHRPVEHVEAEKPACKCDGCALARKILLLS